MQKCNCFEKGKYSPRRSDVEELANFQLRIRKITLRYEAMSCPRVMREEALVH
jgi:hypothetical protein